MILKTWRWMPRESSGVKYQYFWNRIIVVGISIILIKIYTDWFLKNDVFIWLH